MKDIQRIHEQVFDYLYNWSESSRINGTELNPYFYMRSVRDERFKRGYWFPGNDSYLCLSFWSGGDSSNKTPNIYFEIHEKWGCRVIIVSKDSTVKFNYFQGLVDSVNRNDNKFYEKGKAQLWIKQFSRKFEDWKEMLSEFILHDKRWIDEYISDHPLEEYEEFVSRFNSLNPKDFDTMLSRVLKERDSIKQAQNHREEAILGAFKLPCCLLGLTVENFQGIKGTGVVELRADAGWIYITGENGYGKTTILQAIALGLSNDPDLEKYLDPKSRISMEISLNNEKIFPVRSVGSNSEYNYLQNYVVAYGPARLNVQSKTSENMEARGSHNVIGLFESETLLKNINYELFASMYSNKKIYDELEELVKTVTDNRISQIKIKDREVLFVETLRNGDELEPMPLKKLAAGFRSIINVAIDIYLRFKKVHTNLKARDYFGIVLIDEIENHLHPVLQKEFPQTLSKVFPKIQFIVSTHSPIPLLSADANAIILRANRTKMDGVTIERLDEEIDFTSLLPNTILSSPIFGFQDIFPVNKDDSQFVRMETTFDEVKENDAQKIRIDQYFTKDESEKILSLINSKYKR